MRPDDAERLANLAHVCGKPLRVRILIALTRHGAGRSITVADLSLLLVDEDNDDMPPAGMIDRELGLLGRLGVVALERTGPQPSQVRCVLREDGVFAELSELAARARDATLAG